jgi:hypothetical protein
MKFITGFLIHCITLALAFVLFDAQWPVYNDSPALGFLLCAALYLVGAWLIYAIVVFIPAIVGLLFAAVSIEGEHKAAAVVTCCTVALFAVGVGFAYDIWALSGGLHNVFPPFPVLSLGQAVLFAFVNTTVSMMANNFSISTSKNDK